MNINIGCNAEMNLEELLSVLPGDNKDIYEEDAEDLLDQIKNTDGWKTTAAWKKLTVTAVTEDKLELDGISLACPYMAEKLSVGDSLYALVCTAGEGLHRMLQEGDDIMQEYILGFLMSHVLTKAVVQVVQETAADSGCSHVEMIMAGIPEICAMDQQLQIGAMLSDEMEAIGVQVKPGGSLSPTYSSTAFLLLGDGEYNLPEHWDVQQERDALGRRLFEMAGHA